jgi:sulfatase modifying factor 1
LEPFLLLQKKIVRLTLNVAKKTHILSIVCFFCISCSYLLNPKTPEKEAPDSVILFLNGEIYPTRVVLGWQTPANENFACYELFYDTIPVVTESSIMAKKITMKKDTSYIVDGLEPNTTYYFKIFIFNGDSFSASNVLTVTTSRCSCGVFTNEKENGMVLIPSGCFFDIDTMPAVLSRSFFMDTTEITEGVWNRYYRYSTITDTVSRKPVTMVTWYSVLVFCNDRSIASGYDTCYRYSEIKVNAGKVTALTELSVDFDGDGFRLPTEDEWEYAYRAGLFTDFFWGKNIKAGDSVVYPVSPQDYAEIDSYVWWKNNNSDGMIKEIAQKNSNPWHVYDMAGNVSEMVWNFYSNERPGFSRFDYSGPNNGITRVVRGGAFNQEYFDLTAYSRRDVQPHDNFFNQDKGFRTVRTSCR